MLDCKEVSRESLKKYVQEMHGPLIVQHKVEGHPDLQNINPDSLNTIRAITLSWKGEVYYLGAIARFGRNGIRVDNTHAGGVFALASMQLYNMCHKSPGFLDAGFKKFSSHPDSNVTFDVESLRMKMILRNKLPEFVVSLHAKYSQIGLIGWDVVPDGDGFVIIEANSKVPTIWSLQLMQGPVIPEDILSDIYSSCVTSSC